MMNAKKRRVKTTFTLALQLDCLNSKRLFVFILQINVFQNWTGCFNWSKLFTPNCFDSCSSVVTRDAQVSSERQLFDWFDNFGIIIIKALSYPIYLGCLISGYTSCTVKGGFIYARIWSCTVLLNLLTNSVTDKEVLLFLMQVSRSIGDVYMKHAKYNREPINAKFRISEPMNKPILTATPSIVTHPLHPNDSFLIFASDGLWEHLSNEKAVEIVQSHPHAVRFCLR